MAVKSPPRTQPPLVSESSAAAPDDPTSSAFAASLTADEPLILLAQRTLEREYAVLRAQLPPAGEAPSAAAIHQMRIALRKLRVALRLFQSFLPAESRELADELRWFNQSLGHVRDSDVLAESIESDASVDPTDRQEAVSFIECERARAREALFGTLGSVRFANLLQRLDSFVRRTPAQGVLRRWGSLTIAAAAHADVRRSLKRVRKLARRIDADSSPELLHRLRIRAKRLRYEAEFYADYDPALTEIARAAKRIQDLLGNYRDACNAATVLEARCRAMKQSELSTSADVAAASSRPDEADREVVALRRLVQSQRRRAAQARRSYPKAWRRFESTTAHVRRKHD